MKNKFIILLMLLVVVPALGCAGRTETTDNFVPAPPTAADRTFYMGFSNFPPALDINSVERSYALSNQNSDIRLVQLDAGVPWVEMSANQPVPARIVGDWDYIKSKSEGKKIFVAATPLDFNRTGLALYANSKDDNQPLPDDWKNLSFNNPKVEQAYLTYLEKVVDYWHPDYLAISIEANIIANKNIEEWPQYMELHKYLYTGLKMLYPQLPVFATIQLEHFEGITDGAGDKVDLQKQIVGELMQYSDMAVLSMYPYTVTNGKFTAAYFNDIKAFNKPMAVSETGWPSQNTKVFGFTTPGSQSAQSQYVRDLLESANQYQFVFVINWVNVDYNKLLAKVPDPTQKEFANLWVYDGLWNDKFEAKQALKVWQSYLLLPKS